MLADSVCSPSIAVSDLERAKAFYVDTLRLPVQMEIPGAVVLSSGGAGLLVYQSEFAGTNRATYAGWQVSDLDAEIAALRQSGVELLRFEGLTDADGIASFDGGRSAWFADPDGNVLSLTQLP